MNQDILGKVSFDDAVRDEASELIAKAAASASDLEMKALSEGVSVEGVTESAKHSVASPEDLAASAEDIVESMKGTTREEIRAVQDARERQRNPAVARLAKNKRESLTRSEMMGGDLTEKELRESSFRDKESKFKDAYLEDLREEQGEDIDRRVEEAREVVENRLTGGSKPIRKFEDNSGDSKEKEIRVNKEARKSGFSGVLVIETDGTSKGTTVKLNGKDVEFTRLVLEISDQIVCTIAQEARLF